MRKLEKSIHIRVSPQLYEVLQSFSRSSGFTVAWLVRHATQKYLSEKGLLRK